MFGKTSSKKEGNRDAQALQKGNRKGLLRQYLEAIVFLAIFFGIFSYIGSKMGVPNMMNTIMNTAHDLLMNTVFYIMGITVLTGALGSLLVEFHVVSALERLLRPLMKPVYGLPGVAALGGLLTFLSDNPAIISLSKDKTFCSFFKKYQLISLTNFGTAFGMGLIVIIFMVSKGQGNAAMFGAAGALVGSVISTRLMQFFILRKYPEMRAPVTVVEGPQDFGVENKNKENILMRVLNSMLDGGKTGVDLGLAIIPGVLIISTAVMMLTNEPKGPDGTYIGAAYEGVGLLPYLASKIDFVFQWLFGFQDPKLIAFPITTLGAVGAALGLVPNFIEQGILNGNAVAVFTAMGMCWSGFLSTHTAMLDSLGYRKLISQAIVAHTIGGLCAGIFAHWLYATFM